MGILEAQENINRYWNFWINKCTFSDLRTAFTFSSAEFVPDCLRASEVWETINCGAFLLMLIKCCLDLVPSQSWLMVLHAYLSWLVTHYDQDNFPTASLQNSKSAFQLNCSLMYMSSSTLCSVSILNLTRIEHSGRRFFPVSVCKSNIQSFSLKIWGYLFLFQLTLIRLEVTSKSSASTVFK